MPDANPWKDAARTVDGFLDDTMQAFSSFFSPEQQAAASPAAATGPSTSAADGPLAGAHEALDNFLSFLGGTQRRTTPPGAPATSAAQPGVSRSQRRPPKRLNLSTLNPSLTSVGFDLIERLPTRLLEKAGLACERMQDAGLPTETIRQVLSALFVTQATEALRSVFSLFDSSGDGNVDEDEFMALAPLIGEQVPPDAFDPLFRALDTDSDSTLSFDEFAHFVRRANPLCDATAHAGAAPPGWRAFVQDDQLVQEEYYLVDLGGQERRLVGRRSNQPGPSSAAAGGRPWRKVPHLDVAKLTHSGEVLIRKADLPNAQHVAERMRKMGGFQNREVLVMLRVLFCSPSDADYECVYKMFNTDGSNGVDLAELQQLMPIFADHATEAEVRALFVAADTNSDGRLDHFEIAALLRQISPKAPTAQELYETRTALTREQLHQRLRQLEAPAQGQLPEWACTVRVLCLGASGSGKTYLLNQVLSEKLPKGRTLAVSFGLVPVRIGHARVAVQLLDTPGDPRYAQLTSVFLSAASFCLLLFDCTSKQSFDAIEPLRKAFLAANPQYDNGRLLVVSNFARLGLKQSISAAYAKEWCAQQTPPLVYFEVDPNGPQGILEPLRHVAAEYLLMHGGAEALPGDSTQADR